MVTNEVIEVGKASDKEAHFHIAPQSPVFLFTRLSFLENGKPVEYVKSVYRGDRYKIVNRLVRSANCAPYFYCLERFGRIGQIAGSLPKHPGTKTLSPFCCASSYRSLKVRRSVKKIHSRN